MYGKRFSVDLLKCPVDRGRPTFASLRVANLEHAALNWTQVACSSSLFSHHFKCKTGSHFCTVSVG